MDFIHSFQTLVHLVVTLYALTLTFGYELRSSKYNGAPDRKLQTGQVLSTFSARSVIECSAYCDLMDTCRSLSFGAASEECFISHLTAIGMSMYTDYDAGWNSYSKDDWLLVFRAPSAIGGDVYQSYVNGVGITTSDVNCINLTSTGCSSNYRHPILDSWATANISQVRFSFYKNQAEDAYVTFDATGSDVTTWFRKDRILNSSWTTVSTDSYNYFAIEGMGVARRFYMSLNHGGCPSDRIYSVVIVQDGYSCNYDAQATFPQFIYASTTSSAQPETGIGVDFADFMTIFVR